MKYPKCDLITRKRKPVEYITQHRYPSLHGKPCQRNVHEVGIPSLINSEKFRLGGETYERISCGISVVKKKEKKKKRHKMDQSCNKTMLGIETDKKKNN